MFHRLFLLTVLVFISLLPLRAQSLKEQVMRREGTASYYHARFNGRKTATGEIFNNQHMTAASNHFPLGTMVKVTHKQSGKFVLVRINDRMSPHSKRVIDLTEKAARELCFYDKGLCTVVVEKAGEEAEELNLAEPWPDSVSLFQSGQHK